MHTARVTLISPYHNLFTNGVRTLSACLKKNGHDAQLIFLPKIFSQSYKDKVLRELVNLSREADLIGISVMTNFFKDAVQITEKLKESLNVPIVWGGVHPTVRPLECLNYADIVCIGEGEETLVELITKQKKPQDFYNVRGVWFKENSKIIKNELRPLIQDLDLIPFQDFDYQNHFMLYEEDICRIDEQLLKKAMYGQYIITATRGCPFGCSYCFNNTLNKMYPNQKVIRKRSIDNIINELVIMKAKLPFIERVQFDDDAFFMYPKEDIIDFARKYKENIRLHLHVTGAAPSTIKREKLSILADAGLKHLRMGIQSASERTKKLYKRVDSNQQIEKAATIINEFKDRIRSVEYDIILDNPWEKDEDLIETLMFLARLPKPFLLNLYSLTFYPGTELYETAKKEGIITDDLKEVYNKLYSYCKNTYLNRLFLLSKKYTAHGPGLSTTLIFLLTNHRLRKLKLSWMLYIILNVSSVILPLIFIPRNLLSKALKDIKRGDWSRIINYIRRIPQKVSFG